MKMDILIKKARILGFEGLQNISIENNQITGISPDKKLPSSEYTIEGKHLFVTPALVNAHTHTPMTLLRGYSDNLELMPWLQDIWKVERLFGKNECIVGAELAFLEMIKSGTGLFLDFYFNEDAIIKPATKSGLKGILGAGIIEDVFLEQGGSEWMLKTAENVCRSLTSHPRLQAAIAPHSPNTCTVETLYKCLELADKYHVQTHIHVSETRDDVINIQKINGIPPIEWLDREFNFFSRKVMVAHAVWIQQREINILARNSAAMAYCPVSGQKLAYGGMAPIPELIAAGVPVCLGTDGPASNNSLDIVREMRAGSILVSHQRWNPSAITLKQIVDTAVTNFRSWMFGSSILQTEAIADLTIFDFSRPGTQPVINPLSTLVYAATGQDTHSMIVDGEVLMLNRNVLTLDEEKVIENAQTTIQDLLTRVNSN